jgi:hypothetical protein
VSFWGHAEWLPGAAYDLAGGYSAASRSAEAAEQVLQHDPELALPEHREMARHLGDFWGMTEILRKMTRIAIYPVLSIRFTMDTSILRSGGGVV